MNSFESSDSGGENCTILSNTNKNKKNNEACMPNLDWTVVRRGFCVLALGVLGFYKGLNEF